MNISSDLKFLKEGFMNIIDKLVSSQNIPALNQTWKTLKKKLENVSPFEIYLESQKFHPQEINRITKNSTPKENNKNEMSNMISSKGNHFQQNSLLSSLRQAQNDIKLGTSQFASIFNLTSESAKSTLMDEQQFHQYVQLSKQNNQFKDITIYMPQHREYYPSLPQNNSRLIGNMENILQNNNRTDNVFYKWQGH